MMKEIMNMSGNHEYDEHNEYKEIIVIMIIDMMNMIMMNMVLMTAMNIMMMNMMNINKSLGIHRCTWQIPKWIFHKLDTRRVDWFHVAQDRGQWQAFLNMVTGLRIT